MATPEVGPLDGGGPVLDLLLVSSDAGQLAQLVALEPWSRQHRRRWVCVDAQDADTLDAVSLLRGEQVSWAYPTGLSTAGRGAAVAAAAAARNLALAWNLLRERRPDVVIATDPTLGVAFFALARLFRVPTLYLEASDLGGPPTPAERACRGLADRMLVQWEDRAELFPDADLIGCLL